jgi:hypothetical protein
MVYPMNNIYIHEGRFQPRVPWLNQPVVANYSPRHGPSARGHPSPHLLYPHWLASASLAVLDGFTGLALVRFEVTGLAGVRFAAGTTA